MDISNICRDPNKSKGVRVNYDENVVLIIAPHSNPNFEAKMGRLTKPFMNPAKKAKLQDPAIMGQLSLEAEAETILVGWEGLESNGQPFPYTPENAKLLLENPDFRAFVRTESQNFENYRREEVKIAAEALESFPVVDTAVGQ
jgi:hypothetical protein